MNKKTLYIFSALFIAASAYTGYHYARHAGMSAAIGEDASAQPHYTCPMHHEVHSDHPGNCPICGMKLIHEKSAEAPMPGDKQALYWYDPMRPDQHFEHGGQSPFMDMQLVPKYGDAQAAAGSVSIDPRMAQNLGIRTATVVRDTLAPAIVATGSVMADETRIESVQARVQGWVEKLRVRAVGDSVRRGEVLAEIYAPDLLSAQEELLLALRAHDDSLSQSARMRLSLLGMGTAQIAELERGGKPARTVRYTAPADGIVMELGVREGEQTTPGMTLFKMVNLSQVWIVAEIPEALAPAITVGMRATAQLDSLPGQSWCGRVEYLYPDLSAQTRTLRARLRFDNPAGALKPGQFASVSFASEPREVLLVPSEALIRTGQRSVVIISDGAGNYRPVDVSAGAESGGRTEIISGLAEGLEVVASGQFLIDSEANLRSTLTRMQTSPAPATESGDRP